MVDVTIRGDTAVFTVRGVHKLLAFRSRIEVPIAAIRDVRRAGRGDTDGWWQGWRMPGTHIPGVIVAGTFYRRGERVFRDVVRAGRALVVELAGHRYTRLVVEVADPDGTIALLQRARGAAR